MLRVSYAFLSVSRERTPQMFTEERSSRPGDQERQYLFQMSEQPGFSFGT